MIYHITGGSYDSHHLICLVEGNEHPLRYFRTFRDCYVKHYKPVDLSLEKKQEEWHPKMDDEVAWEEWTRQCNTAYRGAMNAVLQELNFTSSPDNFYDNFDKLLIDYLASKGYKPVEFEKVHTYAWRSSDYLTHDND